MSLLYNNVRNASLPPLPRSVLRSSARGRSGTPLPFSLLVSLQYKKHIWLTEPQYLAANPHPPADWNDIASIKAAMTAGIAALNSALHLAADISESSLTIPMRDGCLSTALVRKPLSAPPNSPSPLIILGFGGGFVAGNRHQMARESRALVRLFGAVVVHFEYRLAPEHKFPTAWEDAWDAVRWAVGNAEELGADPGCGVILGGTSAGANLAAGCAARARVEELESEITGVWLNVPSCLPAASVPERLKERHVSMEQNADAAVFPAAALESVAKHCEWDEDSAWRSPVNGEQGLKRLPKHFIQVAGMDCLRDDGLLYDELLREAGVQTRCEFYPGCPHAHATFLPGTDVAEKALVDVMEGFGWMLGREVEAKEAREALGFAARRE